MRGFTPTADNLELLERTRIGKRVLSSLGERHTELGDIRLQKTPEGIANIITARYYALCDTRVVWCGSRAKESKGLGLGSRFKPQSC